MRRLIAVGAAGLCAALVTGAVAALAISPDAVREEVTSRLAALTGYRVEVAGATDLHLFPSPRFAIADVRLYATDRAPGTELATIESLAGSIALLPLVAGRIEIDGLSLIRPSLVVEIDSEGGRNWVSDSPGLIAQAVVRPDAAPVGEARIGDLRIEGGSLRYIDRRGGESFEITAIRATLSWPDLAAPLAGTGTLDWNGERFSFGFEANDALSLLGRGSSGTRISVKSPLVDVSFSGNAHLSDNPHLSGRLALSAASTRRLLRELGTDLGAGAGLDALELSGRISLLGNSAIISDLSMALDGHRAEGSLKVDIADNQIGLQGTLAFEALYLDRYRTGSGSDDAGGGPADPMAAVIDLSDLNKVTADVRISADRVSLGNVRLGETAATVTVRDGALTLGIAQAALHGGTGMGTVVVAPRHDGVAARLNANVDDVAVAGMLADLGLAERLEGKAEGWVSLTGRGHTPGDIVASLSGEARLTVSDGAVTGADFTTMMNGIDTASLRHRADDGAGRTSFERLVASLRVTDGVATTRDFRLVGPSIEVSLEADIRLATASLAGRGIAAWTAVESADDGLPFIIEGPLVEPRLYVDPVWLLSRAAIEPDQAFRRVSPEELIDRVLDQLPGLTGRGR